MRRAVAAVGALTVALVAAPASAAPSKRSSAKAACVAAHEEGQRLRLDGKLHSAREQFVACARSECPVVLRKECSEQLAAVEAAAPTVALEARDASGDSDANVRVTLDGELVAEHLTGASIDVEPGEHAFRFERADGKVIEQKVLVVEGEKNRKIVADFATLAPKSGRSQTPGPVGKIGDERRMSPLVYVAGGVALAGAASFAIFALQGKSKEDDLAGSCAPGCASDDVSPVRTDYLVADISLGVAVVAAAVAVVLALPALGARPAANVSGLPAPWLPTFHTPTIHTRSASR